MQVTERPVRIISCGIVKKELEEIIDRRSWDLEVTYLTSSLHMHPDTLYERIAQLLDKYGENPIVLVYGVCHPFIDRLIDRKRVFRIDAQNCIDMLVGREVFTDELSSGGFFLLEGWVDNWNEMVSLSLGDDIDGIREVFYSQFNHLVAVDLADERYREKVSEISSSLGLEVKWIPKDSANLERLLDRVFEEMDYGK